MKVFAFKTAAQFKNHYLSALMKSGKAPEIKTSRASTKSAPAKEAFVSKRGSVVISKALIDEMGFAEGDKFSVRKTKSGISLKKLLMSWFIFTSEKAGSVQACFFIFWINGLIHNQPVHQFKTFSRHYSDRSRQAHLPTTIPVIQIQSHCTG